MFGGVRIVVSTRSACSTALLLLVKYWRSECAERYVIQRHHHYLSYVTYSEQNEHADPPLATTCCGSYTLFCILAVPELMMITANYIRERWGTTV
jgi:hypothetical protein